ncbi:putative membrane protein [Arcobacter ellisii]|uniref:Membrane protein n=1 Tax=Arcobacter ellisii TaxID=913109 RepID=A0A347U509_9BACT|nr:putative membrane protein [Arcobacter ellisii]RXI33129.1 hypothetical protein CP962_01595 [Arcobacter ellisii]
MKKELTIFLIILIVLTIGMHYKEFLNHPLEQITNLPNSGAYGLGVFHPLIFSFVIYIIILLPRLVFKLFKRKSNEKSFKK